MPSPFAAMRVTPVFAAAAIQHFIFGYGSLICSKSRAVTIPEHADAVVTPVLVEGLQRVWCKRSTFGMTAVGVTLVHNNNINRIKSDSKRDAASTTAAAIATAAECVGVLLPVGAVDLQRFDEREKGYRRALLDLKQVHQVPFLDPELHYKAPDHELFLQAKEELNNAIANGTYMPMRSTSNNPASDCTLEEYRTDFVENETAFSPSVKIWVYIPQTPMIPTIDYPISQTYVDTILRGCLDISDDFAAEFLKTTSGWHPDDRVHLDSLVLRDDSIPDQIPLINDRQHPIYVRGDGVWSLRNSAFLDRFMNQHRPDLLQQRQVCKNKLKRKKPKQQLLQQ